MNNQFREKLLEIKTSEHYLRKPSVNYDVYISQLEGVIGELTPKLTVSKIRDLLDNKLQLSTKNFNEAQYVQSACELAVMNEYIGNPEFNFSYEVKVTPPKDVDFSLCVNNINVNVEVKCSTYQNKLEPSDSNVVIKFLDRAPTKNDSEDIIQSLQENLTQVGQASSVEKSVENNLLSFLESTQEKVEKSGVHDINVLVVCCDSAMDMQAWRQSLFGFQGLFTEHSFSSHEKFERVDFVLLTNLYNRHWRFYEANLITDHWNLSNAFCLLYPNKFSLRNTRLLFDSKQELVFMNKVFPNYSSEFEKYMKDDLDIPNADVAPELKEFAGVAWFSDKYRDRGVYHFREPKGI
ncbi:hypothetical protein MEG05_17315 [Vibrio aestuarianus]|uniref:hypothetical protein n=1 Tax=Vibrio aestuarianus TaxID=28171 RepID=UPI00237D1679|nr:hypothetical protein [Vibrio aestuarianus]MDE1315787.1 hypothetical protein [Vibrio aestuarianus]